MNNYFWEDQLEVLLSPSTHNRKARRAFERIVTQRYSKLKPDAQRHPRLKLFVHKYKEAEAARETLQKPNAGAGVQSEATCVDRNPPSDTSE